jgi:cell division protein FtsQ
MIKKAIIWVIDLCLAAYLLLAITAFNKPDERASICKEVCINIEKDLVDGFLTTNKVRQLLQEHRLYPVSEPMQHINTRQIEETLQANELIEHVECYKNQTGRVFIDIRQRVPVVRVMAENDTLDYCVDSHGQVMPVRGYSCNVLVATGHIGRTFACKKLAPLAGVIIADKFWRNEVVQINVLPDGSIELVPRVGEHIAYLGQPIDIEKKLDRLRQFYRYGLSQAGWNHYSRVSVEFDNQIICKKRKNRKQ